jgi:hypothetical protein
MTNRIVLFSPQALRKLNLNDRKMYLNLDKEKIFNSPFFKPEEPITRTGEERLFDYYGWKKYWEDCGDSREREVVKKNDDEPASQDYLFIDGLSCTREIIGQQLETDGNPLGLLTDLIIETDTWLIYFLVVDRDNDQSEKIYLVNPFNLKHFKRDKLRINVNITIERFLKSPRFSDLNNIEKFFD